MCGKGGFIFLNARDCCKERRQDKEKRIGIWKEMRYGYEEPKAEMEADYLF